MYVYAFIKCAFNYSVNRFNLFIYSNNIIVFNLNFAHYLFIFSYYINILYNRDNYILILLFY